LISYALLTLNKTLAKSEQTGLYPDQATLNIIEIRDYFDGIINPEPSRPSTESMELAAATVSATGYEAMDL
jgi:hypothetical protein